MKKIFALIFLSLFAGKINSQKANYWYFGTNAGLNFNTTPPTASTIGLISMPDNASAISDNYGNLLFYTSGSTVYNKQHSVMANGTGLTGHTSGGQCAVIVPQPCSTDRYIIFHTTEFSNPGYLSYSVVDMSLNSGLGGVVSTEKNISLGSGWTEKLCAIYNPAGNNYWVLSHKWGSSQFVAFSVTSTSIAATTVTTSIGSTYTCGIYGGAHDAMGQLTISKDGTKVLSALTCQDKFEIFEFNLLTGALSNSIAIAGNGGNAWGTAFSHDSKKIYVNSIFGQRIYQYDINTYTQASIAASQATIVTMPSTGYNFGYMELGPDDKLYIAKPSSNSLSVVNNPTATGSSCNFSLAGQSLGTRYSTHGLSRIAYNIPTVRGVATASSICIGNSSTLTAYGATNYTWQPGNLTGSLQVVTPTANIIYTLSGSTSTNCPDTYTLLISVNTSSTLTVSPLSSTLCPGASVTLTAGGLSTYTWFPGNITGSSVAVSPLIPTIYTVIASNSSCTISKTATVDVGLSPTITPSGALTCLTPTMSLSAAPSNTPHTVLWTGPGVMNPTSPVTAINAPGIYTVVITNTVNNCVGTKTISVASTIGPLAINVTPSNYIKCTQAAAITMTAGGATSYAWLPALSTTPGTGAVVSASPSSNTTYSVVGTTGVCTGTGVITITVVTTPTINNTSGSPTMCVGTSTNLSASGANTYAWYPGNLNGGTVTVSPAASTTYTVVGSVNTCTASGTVNVSVLPGPTIVPTGSPTSICRGNSTSLSGNGALSYTWQPGNLMGSTQNLSPTVSTTYTVSGTNSQGCVSSSTILLTVIPNPTIVVFPTTPSVCAGFSVMLTASGASTFTWNPGNQTVQSIIVGPPSTSVYTVSGTTNSCSSSKTIAVTVVPVPTLIASAANPTICSGNSTFLSGSGAASYTWMPGSINGSLVSVSPAVTTIYTLTGANSDCASTTTVIVNVIPAPVLSSSVSPVVICVGSNATLSAGNALSYTWQPGNLSGATQVVTPSINTIYTVSGTNGAGCISSSTILLTINSIPTLNISPPSMSLCAGVSTVMNVTGATSYTWNPGGQTTAGYSIMPTSTTIYTVTGSSNNCVSTKTIQVTVLPNPTVNAMATNSNICAGSSTTLSATGATSYTWFPGGITGQSLSVNPSAPTLYSVVGFSAQCTATANVIVLVTALPSITLTAAPAIICNGNSSTLTASGASSYTWQPGNLTGASQVVSPGSSAVYSVSGSNNSGCTSATTITVTVNPNPTITISPASPSVCMGSATSLTASGAVNYTWMPGNINSPVASVSPTMNTTYTVFGISNNCISSKTVAVSVLMNPSIFAIATPTSICSGNSTTLIAGGTSTYTWQPGNITGSTAIVSPLVSTFYTVTGTAGLCSNSAIVFVNVDPSPVMSVIASPSTICAGSSSSLTASGAINYTWQPGNLTGATVIVTPTAATLYSVSGTNGFGCTTSSVVIVLVNPAPSFTISSSSGSQSFSICSGNTVNLVASGAMSYTWQPFSSLSNSTGASVIANPGATTIYTVTSQLGACSSSKMFTVYVNSSPSPTITATTLTICPGYSVTLSGFGSGSTFTWLPGGSVSNSVLVSPTVTTTYTLISASSGSCTNSQTILVNVANNLTLTTAASATQICAGQSVILYGTGAGNYTWSPGNLPGSNVSVSPGSTTVYTLTGSTAICSSTKTISIQVSPLPTLVLNVPSTIPCGGSNVVLSASGANSYQWNPGNLSGSSVTVTPLNTTVYTVTGTSVEGCTNIAMSTVSVSPGPTLAIFASSTAVCPGNSATLTVSGASSYTWMPGNSSGNTIIITPSVSTQYSVMAADNSGCKTQETIWVNVIPGPQIFISNPDSIICSGQSSTITVSGVSSYSWNTPGLTGNMVIVSPTVSTVYSLTGENFGCRFTFTTNVTVIKCDSITFGVTNAASQPLLYNGNSYKITFTVTAFNSSSVDMHNIQLDDDLVKTFIEPCTYTIINNPIITSKGSQLKINSAFNGGSQVSLTSPASSTLASKKGDTISFSILVETKGFHGTVKNSVIGFANVGNVTLSDSSNNGFVWDPDKDGDPTNNNEITLIELPLVELFIPDGFSPNGDGQYDMLHIKGVNGRPAKFTVFNRWGNMVYETEGTQLTWDGMANKGFIVGNNKLPASTYYYVFQFLDGGKEIKTGFVVLQY